VGLTLFDPPENVLPLLRVVAAAGKRDCTDQRHGLATKAAWRAMITVGGTEAAPSGR
jgi:hypothetical protein